jgi:hypothetical protein
MKYLGGKQRLGKHLSPFLHEIYTKYGTTMTNWSVTWSHFVAR